MDSTNYSSPFLRSVSDAIRVRHYSQKTEKAYIGWVKRFIYFHNKQHSREMGAREVTAFLTHLAADRNVAPSTQNQAFNALIFLYRVVLDQPIEGLKGVASGSTRAGWSLLACGLFNIRFRFAIDGMFTLAGDES